MLMLTAEDDNANAYTKDLTIQTPPPTHNGSESKIAENTSAFVLSMTSIPKLLSHKVEFGMMGGVVEVSSAGIRVMVRTDMNVHKTNPQHLSAFTVCE